MNHSCTQFLVNKADIRQSRFADGPLPPLEPGQLLLQTGSFAFTANNVTYAELGDRLRYWQFFPSGDDPWGIIPVWGFADVAASRHDAFRESERIYGFLPMATRLVMQPERVGAGSFVDAMAHRKDLPPAYNLYQRCAGDPLCQSDYEDLQALLRPVFITSFLIDDFLAEQAMFGADCVLLSSASAKTAFGLAHLLHHRQGVEVIGLTSAGNLDFVRSLGCYHRSLVYDGLASLPRARRTVFVDFAGSADLRAKLHDHFQDALRYSCAVGLSHRDVNPPGKGLPGPRPVFFFAPDRLRKRAQDWGRDELEDRVAAAWRRFAPLAAGWLTIVRGDRKAVAEVYAATLGGKVPASRGQILSLA
jgi:hypothetical protein